MYESHPISVGSLSSIIDHSLDVIRIFLITDISGTVLSELLHLNETVVVLSVAVVVIVYRRQSFSFDIDDVLLVVDVTGGHLMVQLVHVVGFIVEMVEVVRGPIAIVPLVDISTVNCVVVPYLLLDNHLIRHFRLVVAWIIVGRSRVGGISG